MDSILKTGSCSIIIGKGHYGEFVNEINNKLVKVTKSNEKHNELKNLHIVRSIENYEDYYSIPDSETYIIDQNSKFYNYLKTIVNDINIFYGNLQYNYVDYGGDKDLLDTIGDLDKGNLIFWNSYKKILLFIEKILKGLSFLHNNYLAHLDIKPENIMVNTLNNEFKIIDFGFCSKYPFDDYVNNIRGTPGYFPKYFRDDKITPWLPLIRANDMNPINNKLPMQINRKLVYKIDSYCFGRVLYFLTYVFKSNNTVSCYTLFRKNKDENKVNNIINTLLNNDVNSRYTCNECKNEYF